MFTNSKRPNGIVPHAMSPVNGVVGAKAKKIARNFRKSTAVRNATRGAVLGRSRESAAIFFVLEDALGRSNLIVW